MKKNNKRVFKKNESRSSSIPETQPPQPPPPPLHQPKICSICLDEVVEEKDDVHILHLCPLDHEHVPHTTLHKECAKQYFQSQLPEGVGISPLILCPLSHTSGKKPHWKSLDKLDANLYDAYKEKINLKLMVTCGNCHRLKSIGVEIKEDTLESKINKCRAFYLDKMVPYLEESMTTTYAPATTMVEIQNQKVQEPKFDKMMNDLQAVDHGLMSIESFFSLYFGNISLAWNKGLSHAIFFQMIQYCVDLITDNYERRVAFQYHAVRICSFTQTACCGWKFCFRCKTAGHHENKTCEEIIGTLSGDILSCPHCGLRLAKSDGCNTVTCLCKKQFDWEQEMKTQRVIAEFLSLYPENATEACVNLLCQKKQFKQSSDERKARQNDPEFYRRCDLADRWKSRFVSTTDAAFKEYWKKLYPMCALRCAYMQIHHLMGPEEYSTYGREYAADLIWKAASESERQKIINDHNLAIASLFTTMFPTQKDQIHAYHHHLKLDPEFASSRHQHVFHDHMTQSVSMWFSKKVNSSRYHAFLKQKSLNTIRNFCFLYGNQTLSMTLKKKNQQNMPYSPHSLPSSPMVHARMWDATKKNYTQNLRFTNENTCVERRGSSPGTVCFAFTPPICLVSNDVVVCSLTVEARPPSSYISIGFMSTTNFATDLMGTFGRFRDSFGFMDRSTNTRSTIMCNGCQPGTEDNDYFPNLKCGDEINLLIFPNHKKVFIVVNDKDSTRRGEASFGKDSCAPAFSRRVALEASFGKIGCFTAKQDLPKKIVFGITIGDNVKLRLNPIISNASSLMKTCIDFLPETTPPFSFSFLSPIHFNANANVNVNVNVNANANAAAFGTSSVSSFDQMHLEFHKRLQYLMKKPELSISSPETIFNEYNKIIATTTTTIDNHTLLPQKSTKKKTKTKKHEVASSSSSSSSLLLHFPKFIRNGYDEWRKLCRNLFFPHAQMLRTNLPSFTEQCFKVLEPHILNPHLTSPEPIPSALCPFPNVTSLSDTGSSAPAPGQQDKAHILHHSGPSDRERLSIPLTWINVLNAACWYHIEMHHFKKPNQTSMIQNMVEEWSQTFVKMHGEDSAAFMAAAAFPLENDRNHPKCSEEEKKWARAYMLVNPGIMENWYTYNAGLQEPMFGLQSADKKCKCLPRHRSCPSSSSSSSSK